VVINSNTKDPVGDEIVQNFDSGIGYIKL